MPEQRGQKYHQGRLGEALREEIETILEGELGDPRIGLANVSEVKLSPDNKTAHVFVSVQGDETEAAKTLEGLEAARGFIRHEVAERLRLRRPPELFFAVDEAGRYGARIEELLKRINKRRP
jgi:ribosome-binding factor A